MKPLFAMLTLSAMVGCATPPTTVATPRTATTVNAPFERTWNAVIDVFAEKNIPIATLDKASGFIVADAQFVGASAKDAAEWADCGKYGIRTIPVTAGKYNVVVRSVDEHSATVKVTVKWAGDLGGTAYECVTKGVWETDFEKDIKSRAELQQPSK